MHFQIDMFPLLTEKQWREYKHLEVLMNTITILQRKDVTALDADVPLLRPSLIQFNVSELRKFKTQADRVDTRRSFLLRAVP